MALNTVRTTLGYLRSLLGKYTPTQFRAESLDDIYNYLSLNDRISTSGQPTERQFALVKAAGFADVINLAPHDAENALDDEAGVLEGLGLAYTHIPVNFARPTEKKFEAFCERMGELEDRKVWVHCAANMRVSASCTAIGARCWARIGPLPEKTCRVYGSPSVSGGISFPDRTIFRCGFYKVRQGDIDG